MLMKIKQEYVILLVTAVSFTIMELFLRIATVKEVSAAGYLISFFAVTAVAALFALILSFLKNKKTKLVVTCVMMIMAVILYSSQIVYNEIFHTYYTCYSMIHGGQVMQFWRDILAGIYSCLIYVISIFAVGIIGEYIIFINIAKPKKNIKEYSLKPIRISFALIIAFMLILTGGFVLSSKNEIGKSYDMIFLTNSIDGSVRELGLGLAMLLDTERLLFGFESEQLKEEQIEPAVEIVEYDPVQTVDFDSLVDREENDTIKTMHQYFASVTPTKENEMTGIFARKNLIMICAESYTYYAAHPIYTPTLYKLQTEGYVFTNFYNPIWGVSTSDGEYVACQGLIPKAGVWSMQTSSDNYLPYTMGNQFKKMGYKTLAYHNHYAEYYGRTSSHPNMGYTYKGLGTGLKVTEMWPESDLQMIELTTEEFLTPNENGVIEPFHVYYMTVSGHLNYNFSGQAMCRKHRDDVAGLDMSEPCKAYIACNMELDLALEKLMQDLESAGVLEDTVIVMSGDHYPYGLELANISEFIGHSVEETFELYKSSFIIYNAGAEQVKTDKYCSSLDIIPTISNLFGLEYDSRLLMGKDIFSDSWPLVIFKDKSWITDRYFYDASTREAMPVQKESQGEIAIDEGYINNINNIVTNKFNYSRMILENDYYRHVFGSDLL